MLGALLPIAVLTFFLSFAPDWVVSQGHHDADLPSLSDDHNSARTVSSSWIATGFMAVALIRAVLDYVQLVLMLLSDPKAVRQCYAQHCSVAQIKDERIRDLLGLAEAAVICESTASEAARSYHISTHKLSMDLNALKRRMNRHTASILVGIAILLSRSWRGNLHRSHVG